MSKSDPSSSKPQGGEFSALDKHGLYKAIYERRDVRAQFIDTTIPDEVLARVLMAAHHAPSVGFMQPWNFIVVKSSPVKQQILNAFQGANEEAAQLFKAEKSNNESREQSYRALKLEGIIEAPINLCITCDRDRVGPVALGRTAQPEMDLYSSVCAVQNLWLAARSEGLGVGWVSIIHKEALHNILGIPENIVPIAYLCMGYTSQFLDQPELATKGWRQRLPLDELISFDRWKDSEHTSTTELQTDNNKEEAGTDDQQNLLELIKDMQKNQTFY